MSSVKARARVVARAVAAMEKAAEAIIELKSIGLEFGISGDELYQESNFARELQERAQYWGSTTWWMDEQRTKHAAHTEVVDRLKACETANPQILKDRFEDGGRY